MIKIEFCPACGSKVTDLTVNTNNDLDLVFGKTIFGTTTYEIKCDDCGCSFSMMEKVQQ